MNNRRWNAVMSTYTGHKGSATINTILSQIPIGLSSQLTGTQLGTVMSLIDNAYHRGRASTGAEIIDDEAVWIDKLGKSIDLNKLVNL